MTDYTDQAYLKNVQYRDASNLDARALIHERFSTNPQGWFHWVFDTLEELPSHARVLELGSGPGYLWKTCPERIPPDWSITLSDLSPGMVLAAWRNLVVTGRAYKYEQIDAQSIPYADATFDIVIANHMLYHVPNRPKALKEIRRVLKPGGQLAASTIGAGHLKELNVWMGQVCKSGNFAPFSAPFSLENGASQLQPFFTDIVTLQYADNLLIAEIDPLVAYIRSTLDPSEVSEEKLAALCQTLEAELRSSLAEKQTKPGLFVAKDSGLFLAKRPV